MSYSPVVEVTRGEIVESIHFGALAIANAQGRLVAAVGSGELAPYLRSSAKPFQALALVESGAADHFGFTPEQIAIICSSHSGTDLHVEVVESIQQMIGVDEEDLLCGVHPPFDRKTAEYLRRADREPTPNHHNCSGKHSGMLALAKFIGASIEDYIAVDHPVQQRILQTLAEMCQVGADEIRIAVDGCSVPVFAMPLSAAATGYARLADPTSLPEQRREACHRIWDAMTGSPDLVAGPGRFDTALMQVMGGRVLSKGGAEGFQGLAIAPGVPGSRGPALGMALKMSDGDLARRARSIAALRALEQLGVVGDKQLEELSDFGPREIRNWRGIGVGKIRPAFALNWL